MLTFLVVGAAASVFYFREMKKALKNGDKKIMAVNSAAFVLALALMAFYCLQ